MTRHESKLLREYRIHYDAIQDELKWRVGMPDRIKNQQRIAKCTDMLHDLRKRIRELERE